MNISIIIVNYNTKELLRNCLKSLRQNYGEIIVVDNNSTDGSQKMVQEYFGARVKLIKNSENLGFARANNQGAKEARSDFLLFLNSDTIVKEGSLEKMFQFLANNSKIGVVGPKLLLANGQVQNYIFGVRAGILEAVLRRLKKPVVNYDKIQAVNWVTGAALMIRRKIFEQIGGFDENFFMYFEDVDLCWRTRQSGYEIYYYSKAEIVHLGGQSMQKFSQRKKYYYYSQDYFFKKHYGNFQTFLLKAIRFPYKLWQTRL